MTEETDNVTLDVLNEFLSLYSTDADTGKRLPVEHYQVLFPGYEEVIAAEYSELESEPDESPAEPGSTQVIERLGPYRLLREIGHGGQGVVYLAEHEELGRQVALKLLSSRLPFSEEVFTRFRQEAEMASRLQHPGICTLFDAGEVDGVAFIAMQYVAGESLSSKIARAREEGQGQVELDPISRDESGSSERTPSSSRTPCAQIVKLVESAARAVHAVHQVGIVHRDLKPGNILVNTEGHPVVLDFGLAREDEREGQELTRSGDVLGTPAYLPAERLRREGKGADARTDVYGLGVTLYECLTLRRPFEAATRDGLYRKILGEEAVRASKLNRRVSRDLEVVLQTAMEKDPERRYQSALDLAEDLRRVRSYEPIRARAAGPVFRAWRWSQRNPVVAVLLLLLSTALIAIAFALVDSQAARRETEFSLQHSRTLGLVGASREMMESQEVLSLLLAREAYERGPDLAETRSRLHAALCQLHECRTISEDVHPVMMPAVSPSGDLLLANCMDRKTRLWDAAGRILQEFDSSIWHCGFFPDEERFYTTSLTGNGWEVVLRRMESPGTSREIGSGIHHAHQVPPDGTWEEDVIQHVALSPTGDMICTSGQKDLASRLWKVEGEKIERSRVLPAGEWSNGFAVFSPDGKHVLTAAGWSLWYQSDIDPSLKLWDVETGDRIAELKGHEMQVLGAAFSPDGSRLVTASKDGTARLWKVQGHGVEPFRTLERHSNWVVSAVFSPDGEEILTASYDGTARLWTKDGEYLNTLSGHDGALCGATFSPDPEGRWILTWSSDKTVRLWKRDGELAAVLRGHKMPVLHARFLPGTPPGKPEVLSLCYGCALRRWSLDDERLPVFRGHRGTVSGAVFLPGKAGSRSVVATGSYDGTLRFWDADSGAEIRELKQEFKEPVGFLEVSRAGDRLLATWGPHAQRYGWGNGRLTRLEGIGPCWGGGVWSMALSPRGDRVVFQGAWNSGPIAWSEECGQASWKDRPHALALSFSPDGEKLFVIRGISPIRRRILLLDWGSREVEQDLTDELPHARTDMLSSSAFSPDGFELVVGSNGGLLSFFRKRGGEFSLRRTIAAHEGGVRSIRYSRDGSRIVTASLDQTARLWSREGELIMAYEGHEGPVYSACFNSDGSRVLTASGDGTARMWFTDPGELYERVNERLEGYEIPPEIRERYADLLPAER